MRKYFGIFSGLFLTCLVGMGCTSLAPDKVLRHELISIDSEIRRAEAVKSGILSHATVENTQDSDQVKKAVAALDAYITKLNQQKAETMAVLQARPIVTP